MRTQDYDEESILFRYVWRHCRNLMTDLERRTDRAAGVRSKALASRSMGNDNLARKLLDGWGCVGDPAVESELQGGLDAFRQRVVFRLLADPRCQALINRCPRCRRVVATPQARQCLWCGFDWHESVAPPGAGAAAGGPRE